MKPSFMPANAVVTTRKYDARFLQPLGVTAAALLLALGSAAPLFATPPADPICGSPNSLDIVEAIRFQMSQDSDRPVSRQATAAALRPSLSIERLSGLPQPRLTLGGPAGQTFHLETSSDPLSGSWASWLSGTLGEGALSWSIDQFASQPVQYFRLRVEAASPAADAASNFRLLDEQGIARDLFYHSHLDGIAVVAAGADLESLLPSLPHLNELAATYGNKLQIWILLSAPTSARNSILTQTQEHKIRFPVLFDSHGLAARSVGLTRAGEVALVKPPAFTVAYRGEIAGPSQSLASESFLEKAMAAIASKEPIGITRTPAEGPPLTHVNEPTPDYATQIAPIFYKHCAICHRPDGVAPFALTNHSVAKTWARPMKHALLSGKMPPWHADPGHGRYANDFSLPGPLRSALVRWLDAGAPRGDGPDPLAELPPPPAFDEWPTELGEPDALVTIPLQSIKATGSEPYRYIFVQAPNPTDVWLKAAIIRPSNYRAVHHYLVWPGRVGNEGSMDNSTYQAHIAQFVPGHKPFRLPDDSGVSLSTSNWLTFNLHYTPYGVATNDLPVLALWYHKTKPAKSYLSLPLFRNDFSIPPGVGDHPVQAEITSPFPITVHRLNPHMHLRGKRMKYEVFYPNGTSEVLLSVPDYDFNWQIGYELAEPKALPIGARLVLSGAFDNSPQNLANPDPSATVGWGDQSWMEMFVGYIDFTL